MRRQRIARSFTLAPLVARGNRKFSTSCRGEGTLSEMTYEIFCKKNCKEEDNQSSTIRRAFVVQVVYAIDLYEFCSVIKEIRKSYEIVGICCNLQIFRSKSASIIFCRQGYWPVCFKAQSD